MSRPAPEIVLLDFGMGNMRSVVRAFEHAGARPRVVEDPEEVRKADRMVLPGVGSFGDCMRTLRERGLDEALQERFRAGSPYLGICLGLHALFEWGEEGGSPGSVCWRGASSASPTCRVGWFLTWAGTGSTSSSRTR